MDGSHLVNRLRLVGIRGTAQIALGVTLLTDNGQQFVLDRKDEMRQDHGYTSGLLVANAIASECILYQVATDSWVDKELRDQALWQSMPSPRHTRRLSFLRCRMRVSDSRAM